MKRIERGFTLIELMIVVAIIGILASLAISMYQTYSIRAQVAEAVNMAAGTKTAITDAFNNTGQPPADRAEAGLSALPSDSKGSYVSGLDIDDGRLDVTFGNDAHAAIVGLTVSFTPYMSDSSSIIWRCGAAPAPPAPAVLLAGGGVTSAYQAPGIETRYLPTACRP